MHIALSPSSIRNTAAALAATAVTVALAACGGAPAKETSGVSTATVKPHATLSSGPVFSADGSFATVTPAGFRNATAEAQGGPFNLLYLAVGPRARGFATNINVVRERSGGLTDINAIGRAELSGVKRVFPQVRQLSPLEPVTVGGEPGLAVDYLNPAAGRRLRQRQVFVEYRGWVYAVTYTALPTMYAANMRALRQVISSWRWTETGASSPVSVA